MSEKTSIEWCDATFNPWWGCVKVSPACDNCYAERDAHRFAPGRELWGAHSERRTFGEAHWQAPRRWAKTMPAKLGRRPRVFCASMADVFDNQGPASERERLFELIRVTPELDWLLLTKRPQNIVRMVRSHGSIAGNGTRYLPDNVWLGTTAEDQQRADMNVRALLQCREELGARVLFLSIEPMLGPVDLTALPVGGGHGHHEFDPIITGNVLNRADPSAPHLHWVICGGESGPQARPMHPDWARSLRDQCAVAGVPFLFKQWGEWIEPDLYGANARLTVREGDPEFESAAAAMDGFLCADGRFATSTDDMAEDTRYLGMLRVGKKAAGRQLDGVTHDGFPQ